MQNDPINLQALAERFDLPASQLLQTDAVSTSAGQASPISPQLLVEAMHKVLHLLGLLPPPPASTSVRGEGKEHDLHETGSYGFDLLADLAAAGEHGQEDLAHALEGLSLPLAVWIARRGGELSTLEPIVNANAQRTNELREPSALERLYEMAGEIQAAVAPALQKDLEKTPPGRPWRILLLNRAIIATRSHRPELMEKAYRDMVMHLPEEAPRFFREGMGQMLALDYPQPVRQVVEKYDNLWSVERTLH